MTRAMTPAEFRSIREQLGLSQAELAEALSVRRLTVLRYENDQRKIPGPVATLLGLFREGHAQGVPLPARKRGATGP